MPTDLPADRAAQLESPNGHYRFDDPWRLVATAPSLVPGSPDPSLFALGNGNVGVRGAVFGEVNTPTNVAIVNGFYESWTIGYPEVAYGFATAGQTLLTAPSPTEIEVVVDGERFEPTSSTFTEYERVLDMAKARYTESFDWLTTSGRRVRLSTERFVSLANDSLVGVRVRVEAVDEAVEAQVTMRSGDGRQLDVGGDPNDPRRSRNLPAGSVRSVMARPVENGWATCVQTAASGMKLAVVSQFLPPSLGIQTTADGASGLSSKSRVVRPGEPLVIDSLTSYKLGGASAEPGELVSAAFSACLPGSYDVAFANHTAELEGLWAASDIIVGTTPAEQQAIRFAIFQLLMSGASTKAGIAAKGVSSNGYEGHYFWDTEMFLVPFWQHTDPARARKLLQFRHRQLPVARGWAAHLKHKGAFFAWRTINGQEASAYFPAGTAQIHINADIAYATSQFIDDFPDDEFVLDAVEVLVGTARFFASYGFVGEDDSFHLHCVTGPDEYTALIDDNYYTNRMAQANLRSASAAVERLSADQRTEIESRTGLAADEAATWARLAEQMYLGFDETRQIRPQDNSFLTKQRWDFSTGGPKRALLLDQHPTTIYRHQVLKQSDVVLADFVFEREEDPELVRRNFEYYEDLTTGDSSLSAGIQAAVAARIGKFDVAKAHFEHALWTDLDNLHGNAADGVHVATAGSIWLCLVRGFAGIRSDGGLSIDPRLPPHWASMRLPYNWAGTSLVVTVTAGEVSVANTGESAIVVTLKGEVMTVEAGATVRVGS